MPTPFSFEGRIGRLPYALLSLGIFFSQHALIAAAFAQHGRVLPVDAWFLVAPLRALATLPPPPLLVHLLLGLYLLLAAWALAALAFRRAADGDITEWIAVFAIAPVVQLAVILFLSGVPTRAAAHGPPIVGHRDLPERAWPAAAQGVIAGSALVLLGVAMSALGFGAYGYGMFIATPFLVGAMTAYFANREADVGPGWTAQLTLIACLVGGIALVAVALEGIVCIILAAPLAAALAVVGGMLGRAIALRGRSPQQAVSAVALLPLVLALETALPTRAAFETEQRIVVDAPSEAVWKAIVTMRPIVEPPALPFRLGMAYPLRGEVIGEGVGALRRGVFSTGTAIERVTEWVPGRKLAFVVVEDVPSMRELSPYEHVHAPHVSGYFRTVETSFELRALSAARTEVIERTSHELKLEPVLYWLPMARLVVDLNNARVLRHVRRQAEGR